ncbi:MAG: condensation domain-containing protein, partial [Candidatus Hodarchaeota archaeon]
MQQSDTSFIRSATYERAHVFLPGNNILMVARIKGTFNEDELRTAIHKIRQRHPLLRVHIEIDEENRAWFTSHNTSDIPVKIYPRTSEKAWREVCCEENRISFQLDSEPLLRVLWIKDTSVSELILLGQHAICDGTSLVFLMRDILTYIANPTLEVEVLDYLPTFDKAANLDQIKLNPIINKLLTKLSTVWKNNKIIFTSEDFEPFQEVFNTSDPQILTYEMSPDETNQLIEISRKHKVTVNSLLYSAL